MPTLDWTTLQEDLESEDGDRFLAALERIESHATVADLPFIYELVQGDDYSVRTTLAVVIAKLDGGCALQTLLQVMLQNEREGWDNDGIDVTTSELITAHPQEARPILEKMQKSEQADERALAAWSLEYVVKAETAPPPVDAVSEPPPPSVVSSQPIGIITPPTARKGCLSQSVVGLILLLAIIGGVAQWGWVAPLGKAQQDCTNGQHAAWLGVEWTSEPVDATEVAALASDVQHNNLRYLFPFTTYLKEDSTFNPTYDHAADIVTALRDTAPTAKILAWVGLPLKNDKPIGIQGWITLDDAGQRADIVAFLAELVESNGFDGIHVDAETVWNHNAGFLAFLEELRAALPENSV